MRLGTKLRITGVIIFLGSSFGIPMFFALTEGITVDLNAGLLMMGIPMMLGLGLVVIGNNYNRKPITKQWSVSRNRHL